MSREDPNNDFFKRASIHLHVPEVRKTMLYQLFLYFNVVLQIPRVFRLTFYCNLFTAASCKMPRTSTHTPLALCSGNSCILCSDWLRKPREFLIAYHKARQRKSRSIPFLNRPKPLLQNEAKCAVFYGNDSLRKLNSLDTDMKGFPSGLALNVGSV